MALTDSPATMTDTDPLARFAEYTRVLAGQLPGILARPITDLGADSHLDSRHENQVFVQTMTANASTALNYPVKQAGLLEVMATPDGVFTYQRYTTYGSSPDGGMRVYTRSRYNSTWSAWLEVI